MADQRVRLLRIGDAQVVELPAGFELPGDTAVIRREGERLVIAPARTRGLVALLATMEPIEEEWPGIKDAPPAPVRLWQGG